MGGWSEGFAPESALFDEVNRLRPDFVGVTGDMGHNNMDATEIVEVKRIAEDDHRSTHRYDSVKMK